ncbi:EAL domain-containing protein [Ruminococcus albus]|uniref:Diguanylate cyclase (GGDEF) domain-containing protein n=1 Tax=Ruminococcus albus TaxID=1264 RepID=A0A1I1QRA3_RUMAL|nr:EAL domain-containing protein [Ruminococcus albus]SFD22378.1 diguanylate cyclase (GGDEF) domain-containing protein [Ruminococcus albus]
MINFRIAFSFIFTLVATGLGICAFQAYRSTKSTGKAVSFLDASLIPPLLGNLIIIGAHTETLAKVGYYLYFLGMDLMVLALVNFTSAYCSVTGKHKTPLKQIIVLLCIDTVQMLMNPFLGHAFDVEPVYVQGSAYYSLIPYIGQSFHRIVIYTIMGATMMIFLVMTIRMPRIYKEKYLVILITMIVTTLWQTFYIFSRTPINRSMIGLGIFGLLAYYFSLFYRPLKLLDRMLSNIASDMPEALFVFDPNFNCIWINETGLKLTQLGTKDLEKVSEKLEDIFGTIQHSKDVWEANKVIATGESKRYYTITLRSFNDSAQKLAGSFLTIRDTTEEQNKIRAELYRSNHDSLTGLYTKNCFYEQIHKTLRENENTRYYAIFIDIKDFKIINDIFSMAFGDRALIQLADVIRSFMSPRCVYGRLGGDTFGTFMPKEEFKADEVDKALSNFIVRDGQVEYHILVHMGVYELSDEDSDVPMMFDRAHLAISTISDDYNTHIAYYDKKLREQVLWDQQISASLTEAIETMQLRPYLQPIADVKGNVIGAEALARWIHPEKSFMPPSSFIPVFEKNGMIVELDKHMWRCACSILQKWKDRFPGMFISVNISPKDFYFTDVVSDIMSLVKEYGISPADLRIEITETIMMTDAEEKMKLLAKFREEGFIVEMDDFGSGYSSLNLLKDMPVDVLKIDMKFLSSTDNKNRSETIVRNILRLTNELGIDSLTEGVETEVQYEKLSQMGCKMFQGYYFAKPMPVEEFEAFASKGAEK